MILYQFLALICGTAPWNQKNILCCVLLAIFSKWLDLGSWCFLVPTRYSVKKAKRREQGEYTSEFSISCFRFLSLPPSGMNDLYSLQRWVLELRGFTCHFVIESEVIVSPCTHFLSTEMLCYLNAPYVIQMHFHSSLEVCIW